MEAKRILVFRIGQLGDTIIALPAMWAIRQHFQSAHISLLSDSHETSSYILPQMILPSEGLFDQWLTYPIKYLQGYLELMIAIRRQNFDTLVYLAPSVRSLPQVWRDLFFFRIAGIQHFIGHRGFTKLPVKIPGQPLPIMEHETDHLLRRLSLSGIPVHLPGQAEMDLKLDAAISERVNVWLREYGLIENPMIAVGPGSKMPSKLWPEERYLQVLEKLILNYNVVPIIFGGKEDRICGLSIVRALGRGMVVAGMLNIRESAELMRRCCFYLGNDTGTMHLAVAAGLKCVAIFSGRDMPGRWYPYGEGHIVIRKMLECEGCMKTECHDKRNQCLMDITVDEVAMAADIMFERIINEKEKSKEHRLCAE